MRRCSVLLSVLLAAGSALIATAPAAHAGQFCAIAYTEGSSIPNASTGPTCVAYQYGLWCESHHTWIYPDAHVHVHYCYPRPF
ncbi:MAG TPA: hypothetical protein VNA20_06050 [Frankiaceae bacterium]|nr:hypothetical protein [Frankiaceae bacterium]